MNSMCENALKNDAVFYVLVILDDEMKNTTRNYLNIKNSIWIWKANTELYHLIYKRLADEMSAHYGISFLSSPRQNN